MNKHKDMSKWVFLIVSIMALMIGLLFVSYRQINRRYYATTEATIVDIIKDTYVDIDEYGVYSETDGSVYVSYEVDGELYDYVYLNEYSITMHIGDVIEIQYDTRNPYYIESKNSNVMVVGICFAISGLCGFLGILLIIREKKNR